MIASIILLLSVVTESAFFYFPFTIMLVLYIVLILDGVPLWSFFLAGLFLDIWQDRLVGGNSLFFLIAIVAWGRYRKKLHTGTDLYQLIYFSIVTLLYCVLFYRSYSTLMMIGFTLAGALLLIVLKKIFPDATHKKKLSI